MYPVLLVPTLMHKKIKSNKSFLVGNKETEFTSYKSLLTFKGHELYSRIPRKASCQNTTNVISIRSFRTQHLIGVARSEETQRPCVVHLTSSPILGIVDARSLKGRKILFIIASIVFSGFREIRFKMTFITCPQFRFVRWGNRGAKSRSLDFRPFAEPVYFLRDFNAGYKKERRIFI